MLISKRTLSTGDLILSHRFRSFKPYASYCPCRLSRVQDENRQYRRKSQASKPDGSTDDPNSLTYCDDKTIMQLC